MPDVGRWGIAAAKASKCSPCAHEVLLARQPVRNENIPMARRKPAANSWANCKAVVKELIALPHELYNLSEENRRFLHARLLPQAADQTLADAERALDRLLSPSAVFNGRFRHADAKRVVDQFEKASDDPALVADLLIADLEMSFETFGEVGGFEPMVDHLYATLRRLDEMLVAIPPRFLASRASRLNRMAERWSASFGYGISDELVGFATVWNERAQKAGTDEAS
jgi:hypothetical protein